VNFLSVTFDDLNAFAFLKSLYGGAVLTPNIDRVVAMGTTFENSFAQVAVCNASRTSALSGLNPGLTGVHDNSTVWYNNVDPAATLPALLKDAGFHTSIVGKVFHTIELPADVAGTISDYFGKAHFTNSGGIFDLDPLPGGIETHSDHINVSRAIELVTAAGTEPFALFLGIVKPHLGWVVPQEFYDLYPLDQIELPFAIDGDLSDVPDFMRALVEDELHAEVLTLDHWKAALQAYFASISFADAMLGRMLDALEANGQLDNTAILLWTDHGYHLGDKDNWHKFTLWEEATRAPFVLALPGQTDDGQRVGQVVELVDMMPTVLDLLGLPIPDGLSGRSLLPFVADPALLDDGVAVTTMYGSAALRTAGLRYIRYEDGSIELYDLVNDPNQWTNLAGQPEWQAVQAALDLRLRSELASDGWQLVDPGMGAEGTGANELFVLAPGALGAAGGDGDDTYFLSANDAVIVETADGGIDEVVTATSFVLPDHVENLTLRVRYGGASLIGNDAANLIVGSDHLEGRGGDDRLTLLKPGFADGGVGNDRLEGSTSRDVLLGGDGDDAIKGNNGSDTIDGGAGDDVLDGGASRDLLSYASAQAAVTISLASAAAQATGGSGSDSIRNFEDLSGSEADDVLGGDRFTNQIKGSGGDDWIDGGLGDDLLDGGAGMDTVGFQSSLAGVTVSLGSSLGQETGAGIDTILRFENVMGSRHNDRLTGSTLANRIDGGAGNDIMTGGAGADLLIAGDGNDELDGGLGIDAASFAAAAAGVRVSLATSRTQDSGAGIVSLVRIEDLIGSLWDDVLGGKQDSNRIEGGGGNDRIDGAAGDDLLEGGEGDDLLGGGAGIDRMAGGAGDDSIIVEQLGDVAVEDEGGGYDGVEAWIDHVLEANVEALILRGDARSGTGNSGDNLLTGTEFDDLLCGLDGVDHLTGGGGADYLDGGAGADTAAGGAGNDVYVVDTAADLVIEGSDGGTDTVGTALAEYVLADEVEALTGTSQTGQRLSGNILANRIEGGVGDDLLDGGAGADALAGGLGDDLYLIDDPGDAVLESTGEGRDEIQTGLATYALADEVERLLGTSAAGQSLTGNALDNQMQGNAGNDVLDGGAGADLLVGGAGDDVYVVDLAGDRVTETADAGLDEVRTDLAAYRLSGNVERLVGTSGGGQRLSGNVLGNAIEGAAGNDVLDGGAGADTLTGGSGADLYVLDNAGDQVSETAGGGVDTVRTVLSSYVLADEVERLFGASAAGQELTGNGLVNHIRAGAGDDALRGGGGQDLLTGGAGADAFYLDQAPAGLTEADRILDFAAADDTIHLDGDVFKGLTAGGPLGESALVFGSGARDADDRIIYNPGNGNIFYDADGLGGVGKVLIAQVKAGLTLTPDDFMVYSDGI
jgi:Ca2+-binding RTX toxin-like protein